MVNYYYSFQLYTILSFK